MATKKKKNQIANEQKWNRDTQSWWIIEAFLYSFPASIFIDLTIDNGFFFLAGRKRGSMLFYYFSCDYFLFMPRGHQFSSFIIGKKKKEDGERNSIAKKGPSVSVCVGPVSAHWEKERGEWRGGRIQSTRRGTWVLNWYDMMQLLSLFFYHLSTHMHFPFFFLSPGQLVVVALYPTNTTSKEKIERHSGQKKKERERWNWIEFSCRPRAYTVHHCVSFK